MKTLHLTITDELHDRLDTLSRSAGSDLEDTAVLLIELGLRPRVDTARRDQDEHNTPQATRAVITRWSVTGHGCPTVLEGTDELSGRPVYYRLRHGGWQVAYDDGEGEVIASDRAPGDIDGVAGEDEIRTMVATAGVILGTR